MKKRYHSDFILQYKLGLLPNDIVTEIAPSTKHYWRNQAYNNFFAPEVLYAQEKNIEMMKAYLSRRELIYAVKAMYHVFLVVQELTQQSKIWQKCANENKALVVQTIEKHKSVLGFKRALKALNITRNQFYTWRDASAYKASIFKLCLKRFPNQIQQSSVSLIRSYLAKEQFSNWSLAGVYYQMMRDKAIAMSLTTFYRYARKLGISRKPLKKKPYARGIRATAPKQLFHMDVTILKMPNNLKAYIYVLMDNHSRFILNAKASLEYKAIHTFQNLKEGFDKNGVNYVFTEKKLLCDGGSENKGVVNDLLSEYAIKKLVAQKDVHFSNSMVEAVNKRIKYDFLYRQHFDTIEALQRYLPKMIDEYNNKPHTSLFGFTPKEVFQGMEPTKHNFNAHFGLAKEYFKQVALPCDLCS